MTFCAKFYFGHLIWGSCETYLLVEMVQLQPMVVVLLVETVRIRQDKLRSNILVLKKNENIKVHQRTSNNKFVKSGIEFAVGFSVCLAVCIDPTV